MFNPFANRANSRRNIENKTDETIELADLTRSDTVYVGKCTNTTVTIKAEKISKLVIDGCDRCRFILETGVIATVETNKTKDSTFVVKSDNIHTVQADATTDCEFSFENTPENFCLVTSEGCTGLVFDLNNQKLPVTFPAASNQSHGDAIPQFKTIILPSKQEILTAAVVREGIGHFA